MATVAMQGGSGGLTKGHVRVIAASSVGTMFEWYDFYLYGSLAGVIAKQFFSALNPTSGLHRRVDGVRCRVLRAAVRRLAVRPPRRSGRTQIHVPDHHPNHGYVDVPRWSDPELRFDRRCCADHSDRVASAARPCARRRIRWCGDLRCRTCAAGQARFLYKLHPDYGDFRPVPVVDRDPDLPDHASVPRISTSGAGAFRSWYRSSCC